MVERFVVVRIGVLCCDDRFRGCAVDCNVGVVVTSVKSECWVDLLCNGH